MKRSRIIYFALIVITMVLGLASRQFGDWLPVFLRNYAGDALWAMMVFWGIGFLFSKMAAAKVMLAALVFSFAIEFSQLYQADWINVLRHTTLGGLILGYGFLWSDLVCYTVGILIGVGIEIGILNWTGMRQKK